MLNSNLKAMAGKTFLKATLQDIRMIRCSLNETLSLEEVIQRSNQAVKGAKLVMAIPHEDFATYTALIRVEEERALQSGIELVKEVEASIAESKQSKRKKRRKKNKTAVKGMLESEGVGSEEVGGGQTKVGLELGADRDVGAVGARSNGAEYAVNGWDAIIGESKLLKYLIRSLEEKLMSKLDSIQVELRAELNVIHNELSTLYESECQGVAKKLAQLWKLSVEAGPFYRGFKILIPEDVRNKFHSIVSEILPNGSPPFPDPYYAASPSLTIPTRRSEIRPDFVLEVMGASIEPLSSPEAACLKSSGATSIIVVECSRSKNTQREQV
ncbi:hypothetical protein BC829DRAFT_419565 [Chytridium lagenaria]|nr:hypothetical protein BC829DRAFT_419565 [Chytridium lagenaria]